MKKNFCLLFIFVIAFFQGYGQHTISTGFLAGMNMTSSYNTSISKDIRHSGNGFGVGGFLEMGLSKNLSLKLLPSYDQQNWSYRSLRFETGDGDVLFHLQYINLPVMLSYSFGSKIQLHADAGVFGGLLLTSKEIVTERSTGMEYASSEKGDFKNINAGIVFAAGLKIPVSNGIKLVVDIRNNTGFTNIPASGNLKLVSFSALAGLSFDIK